MAAAALVLGAFAGAGIGAAAQTQSEFRYTAEATVLADLGGLNGNLRSPRERSSTLRQVLGLAAVTRAVRESTNARGDVADRVSVDAVGKTNLVRVVARDESPKAAVALANAYIFSARDFIRAIPTPGQRNLPVGTFERGMDSWGDASLFALAPLAMSRDSKVAKEGRWSLKAVCSVRPGCGPSTRIYYPFAAGDTYIARAWVRSPSNTTPLILVLAGDRDDYGVTKPSPLRNTWRVLSVSWTPKASHRFAELSFQTADSAVTTFNVDAVTLSQDSRPVDRETGAIDGDTRRVADRTQYDVVSVAVATGVDDRAGVTLAWALAGLALGAAAAAVGLALAWAASRRR